MQSETSLIAMVMDNTQMGSDRSLHVHVIMSKTLLYAPRVGSWWWKTLRDGCSGEKGIQYKREKDR